MIQPGHCKLCGEQVFTIGPHGNPVTPQEVAMRVSLKLSNGPLIDITACAACTTLTTGDLAPRALAAAIQAFEDWATEWDTRKPPRPEVAENYRKTAEYMRHLTAEVSIIMPWNELLAPGERFGVLA